MPVLRSRVTSSRLWLGDPDALMIHLPRDTGVTGRALPVEFTKEILYHFNQRRSCDSKCHEARLETTGPDFCDGLNVVLFHAGIGAL